MVVTVGAINKKDVNNLYKDSEKTGGEKPIDLIKATRPIVIVDEPQSVDGGLSGAGQDGPRCHEPALHPALLRHARGQAPHGLPPRCGGRLRTQAGQADRGGLRDGGGRAQQAVRAARVGRATGGASFQREGRAGRADRQRRASGRKSPCRTATIWSRPPGARSTPTAASARSASRRATSSWNCAFPVASSYLKPGEAWGDVDALAVQREMIRRTIKEHLDKEKRLRPQGIKVLSLFFIDAVDKYRQYDADGNAVKGDYARIFEEEYRRLAKHPDYQHALPGGGPALAPPRRCTTATSPSTRRAVGRTPRRTTRATATTPSGPTT